MEIGERSYMYKRSLTKLLLMSMIFMTSWICLKELKLNRVAATQAFRMEYLTATQEEEFSGSSRLCGIRTAGRGL